jgi:hypothetical protein
LCYSLHLKWIKLRCGVNVLHITPNNVKVELGFFFTN